MICVQATGSCTTSAINLTAATPLQENNNLAFQGPVIVGPFDIAADVAAKMLQTPNPNGRSSADVLSPVVNAAELVRRPRNRWIIDFGQRSLEDAAGYESPFEYVREHVKPRRDDVRDRQRRIYWWRHGRAGTEYRAALSGLSRQIASPRVSKHRLFVWLDCATLVTDAVVAIARDDDYFFGVLHSHPHELWSLRLGTSLEDRPRYTPTTTFETYPFPWPPGQEPTDDPRVEAIAAAARELVKQRDRWLNPEGAAEAELKKRTLTNLYNARPTWLDLAHKRLDAAVLDAYGWPHDISDEELLERLLALNMERSEAAST